MLLSSSAWGQATGEADSLLGPQTGDVTWSLRQHGLTWETPQMTLHLSPWFTVRHLTGTPPTTSEAAVSPWDNLRGAHFEAVLDGVWQVEGSLEEMQGWAGAWDATTMTESTALPGWGRANSLRRRVDVARARVTSRYSHISTQGDPSRHDRLCSDAVGGLALPFNFSGGCFFSQGKCDLGADQRPVRTNHGRPLDRNRTRAHGRLHREPVSPNRCRVDQRRLAEPCARFVGVAWWGSSRASLDRRTRRRFCGTVCMAQLDELIQHVAHCLQSTGGFRRVDLTPRMGCGHVVAPTSYWSVNLGHRLPALDDDRIALHNAGTPVSAVLRPRIADALWRTELHGHWKTPMDAGGRAATQGPSGGRDLDRV